MELINSWKVISTRIAQTTSWFFLGKRAEYNAIEWSSKHDTSPCLNTSPSHKTVRRRRPLHAAISKFLLEDSSRHCSRENRVSGSCNSNENRVSGSCKAEAAVFSPEPLEMKTALLTLRNALKKGSLELQAWQDTGARAAQVLERLQERA